MIDVIQAGFYSSVQDLGRQGYRHIGVGLSGAMDSLALSVANLLVGNPSDAAGLEITMGSACFTFRDDAEIALGGALLRATLDDRPLPNWWACSVRAGQTLRLATCLQGVRSYLAVRGGIDVPTVLGSASTDLKGGFGGLDGRTLKNGDVLHIAPSLPLVRPNPGLGLSVSGLHARLRKQCGPDVDDMSGVALPLARASASVAFATPDSDAAVVHLLPGPQWSDLTDNAQETLLNTRWQVSSQSNRVGCRLDGPLLQTRLRREMRSHGIMPGVLQLPPSGQPIVQLCDGNTSGGYPVIATVIQADLDVFAQLRPHTRVMFAMCDLDQARSRLLQRRQYLDDIAHRCALMRQRFQ